MGSSEKLYEAYMAPPCVFWRNVLRFLLNVLENFLIVGARLCFYLSNGCRIFCKVNN